MSDALHAERPNGGRCQPECGMGLEHHPLCRVAHPETPEALPLPEGIEVSAAIFVASHSNGVMLGVKDGFMALVPAEARAIAAALVRQAALAERKERQRG